VRGSFWGRGRREGRVSCRLSLGIDLDTVGFVHRS
jgi:hypothetical protein